MYRIAKGAYRFSPTEYTQMIKTKDVKVSHKKLAIDVLYFMYNVTITFTEQFPLQRM